MSRNLRPRPTAREFVAAGVVAAGMILGAGGALAQGLPSPSPDDVYKDIESSFGSVPGFMKALPKAGLAGAWMEVRDLEFGDSALDGKTKALISLAVSAQIPCTYCIWSDTNSAKQLGASDEEIAEAVGIAALTRHWSTYLNGLQIDFEQFKKDMSAGEGDMGSASK